MLKNFVTEFKTAFKLIILLTVITGLIYPLLITGIAQLFFPWQANGSLIEDNGKIIGSVLIGQAFDAPEFFWPRPSATSPFPYNAAESGGSNMAPSNPDFLKLVTERIAKIKQSDPENNLPIPIDLVTASASGLDPEISPLAAYYQATRIAKTHHVPEMVITQLIEDHIKNRTCMLLGQPRVNVLELNIALNKIGNSD